MVEEEIVEEVKEVDPDASDPENQADVQSVAASEEPKKKKK